MKRRILPHLTGSEPSVVWGEFWLRIGQERSPAREQLKGWDYSAEATFEVQPSLDLAELRRSTRIDDPECFDVVMLLDCPSTGRRFRSASTALDLAVQDTNLLSVTPPPGEIADYILLSAHVVVGRPPSSVSSDLAAACTGARLLASETVRVNLEGEASRFPTETVSFKSKGWPNAPWAVRSLFTSLEDSFMGNVRLLINTDHPACDHVVAGEGEATLAMQSALRVDVARQLFAYTAQTIVDPESGPYADGSVGQALHNMSDLFVRADLVETLAMFSSDYSEFDRRLMAGFDLFTGGGA